MIVINVKISDKMFFFFNLFFILGFMVLNLWILKLLLGFRMLVMIVFRSLFLVVFIKGNLIKIFFLELNLFICMFLK